MRRTVLLPLLVAAAAAGAAAQGAPPPKAPAPAAAAAAAPPRARVTGIVFDSLSMQPLAGASVLASGSPLVAKSDAQGRWSMDVDSVGAGTHTFSFFHPALDSLGIAPPTRTIELRAGQNAILDLAMPSGGTLVASACPDSLQGGGRGLLLGVVRDADADKPLPNAIVVVRWTELTATSNSIAKLPRALSAKADANGVYRVCGLPPSTGLKVQARLLPKTSGWIDLQLPPYGVFVQEFLVSERPPAAEGAGGNTGPSGGPVSTVNPGLPVLGAPVAKAPAVALGTAMLTGTVTNAEGQPLEGAQVALVGSSLAARADYKGNFRLAGLPAGTQTVEVRLLSYQPRRFVVNLAPNRETKLAATLTVRAQVLDPVKVTADPSSDIPGFDDRRAHAAGTFFTHQQIMDASFFQFTDVFRQAPGMQVLFVDGQYTVVSSRGAASNGCLSAQFWVDGMKYDVSKSNLDDEFKPTEIEAVEIYPGTASLPPQFTTGAAQCGTIVIWTMRGHFKKKTPSDSTPPGSSE